MKQTLITLLLLAAPMGLHARLSRHNFALTLTGSLGLVGEYSNTSSFNRPAAPVTNYNDPSGGFGVPLPLSVAASGAVGLEFAYMWVPPKLDYLGFELHLGFRLTDMPYFWRDGAYLIQPYGPHQSLRGRPDDRHHRLFGGRFFIRGANPPLGVVIILPLGLQVQWKNLRLSLRHELEFILGYNQLQRNQAPAYRQSDAWKYNLIIGIGWGFNLEKK